MTTLTSCALVPLFSVLYVFRLVVGHPLTNGHADAHAIYILNLLLAFLQPRFDPSLEADLMDDEIEAGGGETPLPTSAKDDEFRPFVRRLPEWSFWCV